MESRPLVASTQHDDLLSEQRVLGEELRSRASEITRGASYQHRYRACWPKQALQRAADEGGDHDGYPMQVHGGRVAPGSYPPGAPTDPDLND